MEIGKRSIILSLFAVARGGVSTLWGGDATEQATAKKGTIRCLCIDVNHVANGDPSEE